MAKNNKYRTSALTAEEIEKYAGQLDKVMEQDQPYLKTDLKLSDLAELMQIPSHQLSQLLNQKIKSNFYDYINRFRVEERSSTCVSIYSSIAL